MFKQTILGLALSVSHVSAIIPQHKTIVNSHYPRIVVLKPTYVPFPKTNKELIEQNNDKILRSILIRDIKDSQE